MDVWLGLLPVGHHLTLRGPTWPHNSTVRRCRSRPGHSPQDGDGDSRNRNEGVERLRPRQGGRNERLLSGNARLAKRGPLPHQSAHAAPVRTRLPAPG